MNRSGYLIFALLVGCAPDHGVQLGGDQIRALFAGHSVRGHHEIEGYDFERYHDANGEFRSHQTGKTSPRAGRWWTSGDLVCIRWNDRAGDLCRNMFVDRNGTHRKVLMSGRGRKVVVTFGSFTPGNPSNL